MRAFVYIGLMVTFASIPRLAAQTPSADSARVLRHELDSLKARLERIDSLKQTFASAQRSALHPGRYYGMALALGDAANAAWKIDRDPGGYQDKWASWDKYQHATIAMFLTDRALRIGVRPRDAFLLTCAGAWGWEASQGYVSWRDGVASCSGSLLSVGLNALASRMAKKVRF